jgi:very-short-patch-repair endonuclease
VDVALLLKLADEHHLLHRRTARGAGISASAWSRAHRSGLLEELQPGISRLMGLAPPANQAVAAAVAAGGAGAAASMRTASALWGLDLGEHPIDLTVSGRRHPRLRGGVVLHRPTDVADLRAVRRHGIPTTNPLRTSLDVGAVVGVDDVGRVVEHFLIMKAFGLATLRRAMARHSVQGRAGLGQLRLLLDDWSLGDKPPDSVLEPAVARLLVAHRLPAAVFHHRVSTAGGSFELDFGFVPQRVDFEVDGWSAHGSRRSFERDRDRDAYLTAAGWTVVRTTWFRVMRTPAWVAARLTETLSHR